MKGKPNRKALPWLVIASGRARPVTGLEAQRPTAASDHCHYRRLATKVKKMKYLAHARPQRLPGRNLVAGAMV